DENPEDWSISKLNISGPASSVDNINVTWIRKLGGGKIFTFLNPARSTAEKLPDSELKEPMEFNFDYLGSPNFRTNDRFRKLNDLLQYFAQEVFNLAIKSDFFQINPDNPSNINYVTGEPTQPAHLLIAQVTDVQRPTSSAGATIANVTWEDIWNDLVTLFNLDYEIDGDTLVIEHISWFKEKEPFDLTATGDHVQPW